MSANWQCTRWFGVLLAIMAVVDCGPPPPPKPPKTPRVVLFRVCRPQGRPQEGAWEHAIATFLARAVERSGAFDSTTVEFNRCSAPPQTCYASSEQALVYCNGAMLERLVLSSALLAKTYAAAEDSATYEQLRGDVKSGPAGDAFKAGWELQRAGDQAVVNFAAADIGRALNGQAPSISVELFADIAAIVFQFVIGHEATHANHETCATQEKSESEADGLFDEVLRLESSDTLFCRNDLVITEATADRCALRQVHNLALALDQRLASKGRVAELARRGSAALLSWYALSGYAEQPTAPRVATRIQQGYLRGPFRGLLVANELASGARPSVCGESAALFLLGAQDTFTYCEKEKKPAGGDIPDSVLNFLPRAIEEAYAKNAFTDATLSCLSQSQ